MTLSQLEYIMEICHCGSMNKASQHLFVSQSTISTAIRELEEEMGITIFTRSNRGIALTEEGQEFLAKVYPIWEKCKEIKQFYTAKEFDEKNSLSISTQRYPFCSKAFVEFLQKQDLEHFRFGFKECPLGKVIQEVQNGTSDIGIIFLSEMTEASLRRHFSSKNLEFHEMKRIRPHVFLNKNHPLAQKNTISLEDLPAYPYVVFTKKDESSLQFSEEANLQQNITFPRIIYINDRATFYNVAAHTDALSTGSGVLPDGYCDRRITAIPLSDATEDMCIGWLKKKDSPLSAKAAEFIEILEKIIQLY